MHLLVRDNRALDEDAPAEELGQTAAPLVFLSFSDSDLGGLAAAWRALPDAARPGLRLARLGRLRHPMSVDLYIEQVVAGARCVTVRLLGGLEAWRYGAEELAAHCRRDSIALALLPGDAGDDARLRDLSTVAPAAWARLNAMLREAGPDNARHALQSMAHLAGLAPDTTQDAVLLPVAGVHAVPQPHQPWARAMLVFYRSHLQAGDIAPVMALAEALAARGIAALGVFVNSLKDRQAAAFMRAQLQDWQPDVVLNATGFSARGAADSPLDAADAPVLQTVLAGSTQTQWADSTRGLGPADLAMQVVLPELDGRLLTTAIGFKAEHDFDADLQFAPHRHTPCACGIALAADRAAGWARLRRTAPDARRVAVVLSDYPGGETGHAVGLDSFASLDVMLGILRDAGYTVAPIPDADKRSSWPDLIRPSTPLCQPQTLRVMPVEQHAAFPRSHCVDGRIGHPSHKCDGTRQSGHDDRESGSHFIPPLCHAPPTPFLTLPQYRGLFAQLPISLQNRIVQAWGEPDSDPAVQNGAFALRHVQQGNLLLAVQPDRGERADRQAEYHDPDLPPRHGYVAFYLWLRQAWGAHAVLHLGTHGTLEWLPGKAAALSRACVPVALLRGLPVIYPFIVNNPGEAAAAKRRLGAVTIGHLTPPLTRAGLHADAADLERLIDEYAAAEGMDRRRTAILRRAILDRAESCGLLREAGADALAEDDQLARLDAYLCDVKDMQIRDGLHVFATPPRARDALLAALPAQAQAALDGCADAEGAALLAALDGRFVPPGPAGAPTRGRADVLPTGRNLFTIDPRAVPTRSALVLARKAADALLRRHVQDHGEHPRSLVIDMWGSACMRTGGEDLALALLLLGVEPNWDPASNRVTGFEIVPLAVLDRPRVDVTLRISGLFRDAFETQILLFDAAVRAVAALEEGAEWNPLHQVCRGLEGPALRRATARVFGAAPGAYGVDADDYLATSTAYGRGLPGLPDPDALAARVRAADAFLHSEDHAEADLLDSTDIAAHAGGFAAAAASLGASPALYHLDSATPDTPRIRALADQIARVVRGRAANPRWVAGQMRHGYRGAAEIARPVQALLIFAATLPQRFDRQFDQLFAATLGDPAVARFLRQANPQAAETLADAFRDARTRGLWHCRRNSVAEALDA